MSLKGYIRKSKRFTVRRETSNTGSKKEYKKFYNKYNRRQAKKEIEKYV